MNDQQMQGGSGQLGPDQTAASLAFVTHLHESMMPKDLPTSGSQGGQGAPVSTGKDAAMQDMESRIIDEISGLKDQISSSKNGEKEIETLKKEIEAVLNDNNG